LPGFFPKKTMADLQMLFEESASHHNGHLCPRQVLGVRMGLYAAELLGLDLPQKDKRLFTFVETDGCMTDGISVATGCWLGRRTMRLMDHGKTAATFIDTQINRAVRISPSRSSRTSCNLYAPEAVDRWHAQLEAYQTMPTTELLVAQDVALTISLQAIISKPGGRVVCDECGEDIINERYTRQGDRFICYACADGAYYAIKYDQIQSGILSSLNHH
jgi:formylmethanofuran dehydrogenase subunit E